MQKTSFADNEDVQVLFPKKITFSLKKKTTPLKKLLWLRKN